MYGVQSPDAARQKRLEERELPEGPSHCHKGNLCGTKKPLRGPQAQLLSEAMVKNDLAELDLQNQE